ncbi:hypothetical protein [Rubrivirga litoralis]|uniref:Outer membrane protein beta-barrel domain-containing protein n=1 Tax=Rubrivirga litoralis TaxID=3075598 RepID=A0ABU3BS43_9BACT|nr:hypothetical protein [Rubrivirga sp. F394]MDT0632113.1 hypothetical protein [Rubrivirga sp. F394]
MRLLVTALALTFAPLAAAQVAAPPATPPASEAAASETAPPVGSLPTGFFGEVSASGGYGGSGIGLITTRTGAIGYHLPSGLSVGAYASRSDFGDISTSFVIGPEVQYERALSDRTTLNLDLNGGLGFYRGLGADVAQYRANGVGSRLEGSVTRRFALGRGVSLATTGGLYGGATYSLNDSDFAFDRGAKLGAHAGAILGLQAEFEAFGGRFAIGPYGGVPLVSTETLGGIGFDAYRSRGGRSRGLIGFTF